MRKNRRDLILLMSIGLSGTSSLTACDSFASKAFLRLAMLCLWHPLILDRLGFVL
jgi:hypothetical protein